MIGSCSFGSRFSGTTSQNDRASPELWIATSCVVTCGSMGQLPPENAFGGAASVAPGGGAPLQPIVRSCMPPLPEDMPPMPPVPEPPLDVVDDELPVPVLVGPPPLSLPP